jgi:integrase
MSLSRPPPSSFAALDLLLAEYFGSCYANSRSRRSRQSCVNVRCAALLYYPEARHALPFSLRVLTGWDIEHPSAQHTPCPFELVLVLAEHFLRASRLDCAVLVLLATDTYLRVSELLYLTPAQIFLPTPLRPGGIALPRSKRGRNQSVTLRSPLALSLLRIYLSRRAATESRVFSVSPFTFNNTLRRALRALGVDSSIHITAHAFRHGGATADFVAGTPMADIVQRGRWKDPRSAQRYIQAAQSLLLSSKLPRALVDRGSLLFNRPQMLLDLVQG